MALLLVLVGQCMAHQLPSLFSNPTSTRTTEMIQISTMPTATLPRKVATTPTSAIPIPVSTTTILVRPVKPVAVTIVFDNRSLYSGLQSGWGFACLVEVDGKLVLFDTGENGVALMSNLVTLGVDPVNVDTVVLSHNHRDHLGGLDALLESNHQLVVYMPESFPAGYKASIRRRTQVVEVKGWEKIAEQIYTTGVIGDLIPEQALVIETCEGLVVITGCAHPGIVEMTKRASGFGKVRLLLGGFHLAGKKQADIQLIVSQLRDLGVESVAPCHCTGDLAIEIFEETFGRDFIRAGAGLKLMFQP